jgi:hypothetical protein
MQNSTQVQSLSDERGVLACGAVSVPISPVSLLIHLVDSSPPVAALCRRLPAPAPDTCIFLCGSPPMVDPLEAVLKERGYSQRLFSPEEPPSSHPRRYPIISNFKCLSRLGGYVLRST